MDSSDLDEVGVDVPADVQPVTGADGEVIGYTGALPDGTPAAVLDTDGDDRIDLIQLDRNRDGYVDETATPDGQGGYTVVHDDDFDHEQDLVEQLTPEQLDEEIPGGSGVLDVPLPGGDTGDGSPDPDEDPIPDPGTDQGSPEDPADDTDPSAGSPEGSAPIVDDGTIVGDPWEASRYWFEQSFNGACVPASVAQIVSDYTDTPVTDDQFVELANEQHLWSVGPDGTPYFSMQSAETLLNDAGVPAHLETGDMAELEQALQQGRGVMLFVDAETYWYGQPNATGTADHAVTLTGIDEARGVVILSDTGNPNGNQIEVPIATFESAWADGNNQMLLCDEPAPGEGDGSGTLPDDQDQTGQDTVIQNPLNQDPLNLDPAGQDATRQDVVTDDGVNSPEQNAPDQKGSEQTSDERTVASDQFRDVTTSVTDGRLRSRRLPGRRDRGAAGRGDRRRRGTRDRRGGVPRAVAAGPPASRTNEQRGRRGGGDLGSDRAGRRRGLARAVGPGGPSAASSTPTPRRRKAPCRPPMHG